jgi:tRNA dimethylallyltransferase
MGALYGRLVMPRTKPIVAIVGTTGAGKSSLAVDIARTFKGEVINADAMQVYQGLDIITNKITHDEMHGVPHHLLGCKVPGEEYVVGHWVSDTIQLVSRPYIRPKVPQISCQIEDMHARDVLPVIVGGTTYWMQHLLFPNRLVSGPSKQTNRENIEYSPIVEQALASLSGEQRQLFNTLPVGNPGAETIPSDDYSLLLHTLLSSIDPDMASRWHWRDTRKVLRNLQIIKESGQRASEIVREQDRCGSEAR